MITFEEWLNEYCADKSCIEEIRIDKKFRNKVEGELNIENCPNLTKIFAPIFFISKITSVRINQCPSLEKIGGSWFGEEIQRVEIVNCSNLTTLDFSVTNNFRELKVSNCPKLTKITAKNLNLEKLELDRLPNLLHLDIEENNLSELDTSQLSQLETLLCRENPNLRLPDLTHLVKLTKFTCDRPFLSPDPERQQQIEIVLRQQIITLQTQINQLESQNLPQGDETFDEIQEEIKAKDQQIQTLENKIKNLIESSKDYLANQIQKIAEVNHLKEQIQALQTEKLKLEQEKEGLIVNFRKEKKETLAAWEEERVQLVSEINKLLQERKHLKDENNDLAETNEQKENIQQQLELEIIELQKQLKTKEKELKQTQTVKQQAEVALKKIKQALKGQVSPEQLEQILKNSQEYEKVVQELTNKNQQTKQNLEKLQEKARLLEQAKDKIKKLESEKQELEKELGEVKKKKTTIVSQENTNPANFSAWLGKHKPTIYKVGWVLLILIGLGLFYRLFKEVGN